MSRCDFTDLEKTMCAHCHPPAAAPLETPHDRPWFTALYPGDCAVCGEPFPVGTQIRLHTPAGWRAQCCPSDGH